MRDCSTLIAICGVACAASLATAQPTFTDESAARLPASLVNEASLTEKDYGMGDLDGDGDIDIVVGLRLALNFPANLTQAASTPNVLLFNDGTGVFTDVTAANAPALAQSLATRDILVHDLDADGDLDIIVANGDNDTPQVLLNDGSGVLNDGSGVFTDETAAAIPGGMNIDAWTVSAGDVLGDGDGADDVYFGVRAGNPPVDRLLINQGVEDVDCFADCNDDGNLNILDFTCYQGLFASGAAEADCNGDGNLNILDFTCFQAAFSAGCPEGLGAWLGFVRRMPRRPWRMARVRRGVRTPRAQRHAERTLQVLGPHRHERRRRRRSRHRLRLHRAAPVRAQRRHGQLLPGPAHHRGRRLQLRAGPPRQRRHHRLLRRPQRRRSVPP